MKWLCIGLLVANIVYFSWEYNQQIERGRAQPASIPPLPAGIERLTRVQELAHPPLPLTEQTAPEAADTSTTSGPASKPATFELGVELAQGEPPATPTPQACMSVGPFPSKGATVLLRQWLAGHQVDTAEREESQEEAKNFWVYLKPQETQEATQQMLEDLKRRGIQDYLLLPEGEMKGAISLGIYATQKTAERRLTELVQKGYPAEMGPYTKAKRTYYWIDIWGDRTEAVVAEGQPKFPAGVSAVSIPCSEIAMRNPVLTR